MATVEIPNLLGDRHPQRGYLSLLQSFGGVVIVRYNGTASDFPYLRLCRCEFHGSPPRIPIASDTSPVFRIDGIASRWLSTGCRRIDCIASIRFRCRGGSAGASTYGWLATFRGQGQVHHLLAYEWRPLTDRFVGLQASPPGTVRQGLA